MSTPKIDYSSVRYTQEYFYPTFSNGKMSVAETYVLVENGFLDPASFAPITIFEHDGYLYCIDTRRVTIAKELQRKGKIDILKRLPIEYVREGDRKFHDQHRNLVDDRLPSMRKKGLDGSTAKLYEKSGYMCCYTGSARFRDDLTEHIACDHLQMDESDFRSLNTAQCGQCYQKSTVVIHKPSNKGSYRFIRHCSCEDSEGRVLLTMDNPWTDVGLLEICRLLAHYAKQHSQYAMTSSRPLIRTFASKDFENINYETKESAMSASRPTALRQRTVLEQDSSNQQRNFTYTSPHNEHFKQQESDNLIKGICQFLILFLLIAFIGWLLFTYLSQSRP